jgi:glycosyltransferase involved in cell wall biosynthesis
LQAIRAARRQDPATVVVDDAGRPVPWGPGAAARELMRGLWQRGLDALLTGLAALVVPRRSPPVRTLQRRPDGPVVLVLPVLPDLSHTFVYREVLRILRSRPDWRVVVLERNEKAPVHPEVAALLPKVSYVPREGVTARAWRLLQALATARGREVFALYRAQPGGGIGALLGRNPLRDPRHPGNAFRLADLLAPLRPRELHVYSSTYPANVALGAAHVLGCGLSISSYVDFEFPYAHKLLAEKVARARFFRVVSAFCRDRLRELPGLPELPDERVPVIDFGIDLSQWPPKAPLVGRGVIVSAARLVPKKGFHVVPPALAALRARGIQCRWRLIGDGPERAALQAACAQHGVADLVDFLGARNTDAVRDELLGADLALLPCVMAADGERDGIPVFLAEAMALGVPVVTTPVAGIPELVQDGATGFLSPPGDAAALGALLAGLLADPARARAVARAGRAFVERKFDVAMTANQLIERIER